MLGARVARGALRTVKDIFAQQIHMHKKKLKQDSHLRVQPQAWLYSVSFFSRKLMMN